MAESSENYLPQNVAAKMQKQAVKVWLFGLILVAAWVLVIAAAPIAKANNFNGISSPLYYFFGFVCHQIPDRSFHILGEQVAVCSRCLGVYLGLLLGFVVYPLGRSVGEVDPLPRFWLFLSLIPIGIDWSLTVFGIWENTQVSRFITGLILGVACAIFIIPAIVEITRNLTYRRLMSEPRA